MVDVGGTIMWSEAAGRSSMNTVTLTMTGITGLGLLMGSMGLAPVANDDAPEEIILTGVVRDFQEKTAENGHPDFEQRPNRGFGMYCGNVSSQLGQDGKPAFNGQGWKLRKQWKDSNGRNICWKLYDQNLGDSKGRKDGYDTGGISSSESFSLWFRDDPRYNSSKLLDMKLERQPNGAYVFDSDDSEIYSSRGGFFPIDHELYGNSGGSGPDHNFHFTFELKTEFTYSEDGAQVFTFRGDDDVWVFINNEMVIDLGGVHGAIEQTVDLNRLGLADGEVYELAFFFAERHRTQSNFRITTNLKLETIKLPTVTAAYD